MSFRIVVIGLGRAGGHLHLPALERIPHAAVVGVHDADPARLDTVVTSAPRLDDLEAALSVPADGVVVATPPDTHVPLALAALAAGRHVYLEKPMATSIEDARRLADAAESATRSLQIGFAYRFHPLWTRAATLVADGRATLPVRAVGTFHADAGEGWNHPFLNVGLHHVDLLTMLIGRRPATVHAESAVDLTVTWDDGSVLHGTYGPGPDHDTVRLHFPGRVLDIDRRTGNRLRGAPLRAALPVPSLVRARPSVTGWERSFEHALRAFVESAARGRPPQPGPAEGLDAVAAGVAIVRSLATGDREAVDP